MLQKVTNIEGLDSHYEEVEMSNDTDPTANRIRFFVKAETMPFLTAESNRLVKKNFVFIEKIVNLGNLITQRRIRDKVSFDESTQKWKIQTLGAKSDIKEFPAEWNAFYRGSADDLIGTPLEVLFKNDPAKCDMYSYHHIKTVEQLSQLSHTQIEQLGFGTKADVEKAQALIAATKEGAPAIELNYLIDEKNREIALLNERLSDLSLKLTEVLNHQMEGSRKEKSKPKGKKPSRKVDIGNDQLIEGM